MLYASNQSETNVVRDKPIRDWCYTRHTNQKLMLYASNQWETDIVRVEPIRN